MNIENKVMQIIADYTQIEAATITETSRLVADLGINSFDLVELILEFEDEFAIKILDQEIKSLLTVADITKLITTKLAQNQTNKKIGGLLWNFYFLNMKSTTSQKTYI